MRVKSLVVGLGFLMGIPALAQTSPGVTRSLSLDESIRIALEHNLDLKIERLNPEIARYQLNISYAGWDPSLDIGGTHSYSQSAGGIDAQSRPFVGTTTETDRFSTGLRGVLPTGLTYSLGGDMASRSGLNAAGNFENTSGGVSVTLEQPLLKNFWIDSTRLNIQVNKRRLKVTEEALRLQVMTVVNNVEQVYYDLILAQETVKVQEKALQLAERLLSENKKRVEVGALAPLDEKQAESQVAARRADVLSAQRSLTTQQNLLKSLLSDNYSQWQDVTIMPTDTLQAIPQTFSVTDSWQKGLTQRPDVAQAKLELERLGFVLKYQRNQLYPELNLEGSYGHAGSKREYAGAFGDIQDGNSPFWSYGARLSMPLGRRVARNNYRMTKADQDQALLQLKRLEQDTMVAIDEAIQRAQTSFDRVSATRAAREYSEAALEAEQKKLENGKSTSFVVLQLQRDLTSARSAEVQALADYNKALANLALREGSTLIRSKVALDIK